MTEKYEDKTPREVEEEEARLENIAYNKELETEDLPEYEKFEKTKKRVRQLIKRLKEKGLMTEEQVKEINKSIQLVVDDELHQKEKTKILTKFTQHLNNVENKLKQLEMLIEKQANIGGANDTPIKLNKETDDDTFLGKALTRIKKFFTGGKKTRKNIRSKKQRKSKKVKKTRKNIRSKKQRKNIRSKKQRKNIRSKKQRKSK